MAPSRRLDGLAGLAEDGGRKVADVARADTDNEEIVGWITGARPSQFGG